MTYGVQGEPLTISSTPEPAPQGAPERTPEVVLEIPRATLEMELVLDDPAPPSVEEVAPPEQRAAVLEAENERLRKITGDAGRLVAALEDRAARALIKSDYQKGQRDATLACATDLRNALGI